MLSMRLHLADLQEPKWRSQGGRWTNGESWIEPANVSALVMEVNDDQAPRVRVRVMECKRDEADFVELTMKPGQARLAVGVFGTAPLYLTEKAGELHASWDLTLLRPHLRADRLVPRVVARTLTRQHRYTSETLFEGVYRLTERAAATFTPSGLSIHYPDPAEHVLEPRTLRPGVDPLTALDELLTDVIRQAPTATGCVGVELSGGADSGNVALAVKAARFPEVYSFGLLVGGSTGRQQSERRRALVDHCGFRDTVTPAMQHPPFCAGGVRDLCKPHDPAGAFYQEAFEQINTMHRHWMLPSGDEARDEIRRRVLFPQELERYAEAVGFEVLDMLDGTGTGFAGPPHTRWPDKILGDRRSEKWHQHRAGQAQAAGRCQGALRWGMRAF